MLPRKITSVFLFVCLFPGRFGIVINMLIHSFIPHKFYLLERGNHMNLSTRFLSVFYWLCYYSCPSFFSSVFSSILHHTSHQHFPPYFMFMCHTYKFLGFSISYTILNLPLIIFYLPFMLLIPCTFSLFSPPTCSWW